MANNYCEFSSELELHNDAEKEWWINALGKGLDYEFGYEINFNKIWFYGREFGNPEKVAYLVYRFFETNRSNGNDCFVITYANYCSKLRVDEFDGGTIVATKEGIGCCWPGDQFQFARQRIFKPINRFNKEI